MHHKGFQVLPPVVAASVQDSAGQEERGRYADMAQHGQGMRDVLGVIVVKCDGEPRPRTIGGWFQETLEFDDLANARQVLQVLLKSALLDGRRYVLVPHVAVGPYAVVHEDECTATARGRPYGASPDDVAAERRA